LSFGAHLIIEKLFRHQAKVTCTVALARSSWDRRAKCSKKIQRF
jgi:hypothetical protein